MDDPQIISQAKMMEMILPIIKSHGQLYRKYQKVWAKKAEGGEEIITMTSDGVETTNTAEEGDFIVKNLTEAREEYIVDADKFKEKVSIRKRCPGWFFTVLSPGQGGGYKSNRGHAGHPGLR